MAIPDGINVDIRSDGKALKCYHDPDGITIGREGFRKYIEAVTDATFEVEINLTRDFHFGRCDGLEATFIMDGRDAGVAFISKKAFADKDRRLRRTYTAPDEYCTASRTWRKGFWSFAKLDIQETVDVEAPLQEVKHLGSITVSVKRVQQMKCRPIPAYRAREHQRITEVPEKLLKGQAISNSIGVVKGEITSERPPREYHSTAIPGPSGEAMEFTFLYRSKHALQVLGCIPRTPSPDPAPELSSNPAGESPDAALTKIDTTLSPSERDRKITALKNQLARLERNPNVKPEPGPSTRSNASSGSSAAQKGVKREYDGVEILSERKRSRPSGPIETVDLTGD